MNYSLNWLHTFRHACIFRTGKTQNVNEDVLNIDLYAWIFHSFYRASELNKAF